MKGSWVGLGCDINLTQLNRSSLRGPASCAATPVVVVDLRDLTFEQALFVEVDREDSGPVKSRLAGQAPSNEARCLFWLERASHFPQALEELRAASRLAANRRELGLRGIDVVAAPPPVTMTSQRLEQPLESREVPPRKENVAVHVALLGRREDSMRERVDLHSAYVVTGHEPLEIQRDRRPTP